MDEDQMRCLVLLQHRAYRRWQLTCLLQSLPGLSNSELVKDSSIDFIPRFHEALAEDAREEYVIQYKFAKSISEHLVRDGIHLIEDSGTASRFDDKRDILFCNLDAYIIGKEDTEKLSSRYLKA